MLLYACMDQSDHGCVLHMNALVEAMNEDQDSDQYDTVETKK